jgi:hypothetical protein
MENINIKKTLVEIVETISLSQRRIGELFYAYRKLQKVKLKGKKSD